MGLAETAQLSVRIGLDDKLSPGLKKINGSLGKFEGSSKRVGKGVGQLAGGLAKVGLVAGGAIAVGLGAAAKTAIEFDDAFASVRKTVSASEPELNALNDQLHALATRIPVKYTDLADIAAEAGALGVPTKSVAKFTETVARLSASTQGLSVDAAAEAFGKFRNVLHLADSDLTRAASSLIALGNAGASSEGDIIEIAKRFGAAGHQAGLSAPQVLGLSSAIASLAVEPEAAGSSLSRLFNNITKYIGTGDKKIVAFAKTAGLSVKSFSKFFAKDATGAVELFLDKLKGLDRFQAANVLKKAGITNVRDINAILLLSQNVGEVKRQIDLASDAFKKNTELQDVSAKRFDTLKNKITQLKNGFLEAGYNISVGFLPALGRVVEKLSKFLALDTTKSSLRSIGTEIGKAIDSIDFDKLFGAVKGFATLLEPALKTLLKIAEIVSKLPPELVGAGAGLIITNKVTGGALSSGVGNIFGGLGETLAKSLAAKIPLFGSAFVQPVFVTNQGFGGTGNPIANAAGSATGGKFGKLATVAKTATNIVVPLAVGIAISEAIKEASGQSETEWQQTLKAQYGRLGLIGTEIRTTNSLVGQAKTTTQAAANAITSNERGEGAKHRAAIAQVVSKEQASIVAFRAGERAQLTGNSLASTANDRLNAIRRKRTSFTVHTNVAVNTRISVRDMTGAQAYRTRVARTTSLSAGDSGYNNAGK